MVLSYTSQILSTAPQQTHFSLAPQQGILIVLYVLIPLVGVMATSYAFGARLDLALERRRCAMWAIGIAATILFVILSSSSA
jgi:hypothetical protein